ncbi:MAG: hypothetical protein C4550_07165 [Nitrospiraceae bacterium]|nr:MAG: hypothetical protein C4550_07165 [Nitrospiraceae bacterium]
MDQMVCDRSDNKYMKKKYWLCLVITIFLSSLYLPPVVFGQDCKIPSPASTAESPIERVKLLSEVAANKFQNGDIPCAMSILKRAANIVGGIKSGQERTIAGYEIKDVVFNAIEDKKLTDTKTRKQAIYLALQSIAPKGEVLSEASSVERINDISFLFRIANLLRQEDNVSEASETFLMMLQLSKTIEKSKIPYGSHDMTQFTKWLLEQSAFSTIIRILKEIPQDNNRDDILTSIAQNIPYSLGLMENNKLLYSYSDRGAPSHVILFDKQTTLRFADDAEQLMKVLAIEPTIYKNISSKSFQVWNHRLYRFIWQSYLVAGEKQDAQQKLAAWMSAIRQLGDRVQRVNAIIIAAQSIYAAGSEKPLALSLLSEAEEEAKLIDNPGNRIPILEWISRNKTWMK